MLHRLFGGRATALEASWIDMSTDSRPLYPAHVSQREEGLALTSHLDGCAHGLPEGTVGLGRGSEVAHPTHPAAGGPASALTTARGPRTCNET